MGQTLETDPAQYLTSQVRELLLIPLLQRVRNRALLGPLMKLEMSNLAFDQMDGSKGIYDLSSVIWFRKFIQI